MHGIEKSCHERTAPSISGDRAVLGSLEVQWGAPKCRCRPAGQQLVSKCKNWHGVVESCAALPWGCLFPGLPRLRDGAGSNGFVADAQQQHVERTPQTAVSGGCAACKLRCLRHFQSSGDPKAQGSRQWGCCGEGQDYTVHSDGGGGVDIFGSSVFGCAPGILAMNLLHSLGYPTPISSRPTAARTRVPR